MIYKHPEKDTYIITLIWNAFNDEIKNKLFEICEKEGCNFYFENYVYFGDSDITKPFILLNEIKKSNISKYIKDVYIDKIIPNSSAKEILI